MIGRSFPKMTDAERPSHQVNQSAFGAHERAQAAALSAREQPLTAWDSSITGQRPHTTGIVRKWRGALSRAAAGGSSLQRLPNPTYLNVLALLDGNARSEMVAQVAASLAAGANGRLTLLHTWRGTSSWAIAIAPFVACVIIDDAPVVEPLESDHLRELARRHSHAGLATICRRTTPRVALISLMKKCDFDAVVVRGDLRFCRLLSRLAPEDGPTLIFV